MSRRVTCIADFAIKHGIVTLGTSRTPVSEGCLLGYGSDPAESFRRGAYYVDRILAGATPAELPVARPTIYKLSINRKTAAALGLAVPQALLLRADEVIS